jgi:hypothetical protein
MLNDAFNAVADFHDKDVVQHKNQKVWWDSMRKEFHAMETKGGWELEPMSSMPPGRKVIGNRWYSPIKNGCARF